MTADRKAAEECNHQWAPYCEGERCARCGLIINARFYTRDVSNVSASADRKAAEELAKEIALQAELTPKWARKYLAAAPSALVGDGRRIVESWLGSFAIPPEITFQQSETLQYLIDAALTTKPAPGDDEDKDEEWLDSLRRERERAQRAEEALEAAEAFIALRKREAEKTEAERDALAECKATVDFDRSAAWDEVHRLNGCVQNEFTRANKAEAERDALKKERNHHMGRANNIQADIYRLTHERDAALAELRKERALNDEQRDAALAEAKRLRAALEEAEGELVNLLPHIPQACKPGHEGFIDAHVDVAITAIRAVLAPTQEKP